MQNHLDSEKTSKSIGKNIAKHRQLSGLTQENVAEYLNIGNEAVSRMERGIIIPNALRLIELAQLFNCHVSELLGENETAIIQQSNYLSEQLDNLEEADKTWVLSFLNDLINRLKHSKK